MLAKDKSVFTSWQLNGAPCGLSGVTALQVHLVQFITHPDIFSINWFRESVSLPSVRSCRVNLFSSYFLNCRKTATSCRKTAKLPTGCRCSAVSGDRICLAFCTSTNSISAVTRSSLPFRMSPTYFFCTENTCFCCTS